MFALAIQKNSTHEHTHTHTNSRIPSTIKNGVCKLFSGD